MSASSNMETMDKSEDKNDPSTVTPTKQFAEDMQLKKKLSAPGNAADCGPEDGSTRPALDPATGARDCSTMPVLDPATGEPMSKRKRRKLEKTAKWEAQKYVKRQQERERKKERRKEMREQGLELGPSRKTLKKNKMADSACKVKVAVDCSFDDFMSDKDIGDIVKQISHSYAANRRTENPLQFYVTSVEKKMKAKMDAQEDTKYWDIHFEAASYEELFAKEDIVYLSSDSQNVLQDLTEDKVYVIGGLVDHNHHKGLCHQIAEEKGLYHARLPIDEFIKLHSRKVLSINQVVEILVQYTETGSWEEAFLKALPKRKGAQGKSGAERDNTIPVADSESKSGADSSDSEKNRISVDICGKQSVNEGNSVNNASAAHFKSTIEVMSEDSCRDKLEGMGGKDSVVLLSEDSGDSLGEKQTGGQDIVIIDEQLDGAT